MARITNLSARIRRGKKSYRQGLFCEFLARVYLYFKGYRCLAHRLKTPFGEIDLACRKDRQLVLVEVKSGKGILERNTSPIGARQIRHLLKTGEYLYASQCEAEMQKFSEGLRFDIVLIDVKSWRLKHYRNVLL